MGIRRILFIALPLLAALAAFVILNAGGTTANVRAQAKTKIELDMDPTNGDAPCNPVDASRDVAVGDTYQVAICLTNAPQSVAAFNVEVNYDSALDQCVPKDCSDPASCPDGNPDANFGSTSWTTPDLGACDCTSSGLGLPTCDYNPAPSGTGKTAYISCVCNVPEQQTLPSGEGVSSPLAMVTFKKTAAGADTLDFGTVAAYKQNPPVMLRCPGAECFGGSSDAGAAPVPSATPEGTVAPGTTPGAETPGSQVPTENPNAGPIATAAAGTAVAQGTPIASINQAATATAAAAATKAAAASKTPTGKATAKPGSTSEKSSGSSGPNGILIAGIAVVAAVVAGGAGWFGYRRFRATR
jgi:hypothetical protein